MADTKDNAAPKAPKLLHLRLDAPVNGIVAGRIVSAFEKRAASLKREKLAKSATKEQVALAGGNIPHIND